MEKRVTHLKKNWIAEYTGWVGAAGILSSYALLSFGIVNGQSVVYHGLLLIGSIGLSVVTYRHRAFQSFIVNVTFTILAVIALIRIIFFA